MKRFNPLPATAAALLCVVLAGAAQASNYDGQLDPTWSPTGTGEMGMPGLIDNYIDLGGSGNLTDSDHARAVAIQADGKVLVVGWSWTNSYTRDHNTCTLMRYNVDGSIDTSFGANGRAYFDIAPSGDGWDCQFESLAVQSDGKILAAGTAYNHTGTGTESKEGLIVRYWPNGVPDLTFSPFGDSYEVGSVDTAFHKVVAFEGGALAVGSAVDGDHADFYWMLIGSDGFVDQQFGQPMSSSNGVGGSANDTAYDVVVEHGVDIVGGGPIGVAEPYTKLYLVGTALIDITALGNPENGCAIAVFKRNDFLANQDFYLDTAFNYNGNMNGAPGTAAVVFPVAPPPNYQSQNSDTHCYTAIARPGGGDTGVIVGGESFYSHDNSGSSFDASRMVLAEVYADANAPTSVDVTEHLPYNVFLNYYADDGQSYNSIRDIVALPDGKYAVDGTTETAGILTPGPTNFGVMRLNASFSRDGTFGGSLNPFGGVISPSLDNWLGSPRLEQAFGIAYDPARSRLVVAGDILYERCTGGLICDFGRTGDYDFEIGAIQSVSDRIFADGFDP